MFAVGENAAKVFVIADKMSKNYCNDFYPLPEGTEDVSLLGENKFNLTNGNAFRFENNDTEEVLENRKRGRNIGFIILGVSAAVGFVAGFVITFLLL